MKSQFTEKRVTLLLTDMVGFAQKTVGMTPRQVSNFLIQYRSGLESLIMDNGQGAQHIEHVAGDATASVFETKGYERNEERSKRAFVVALKLLYEMASDRIPPTRIGLYSGRLIETPYNDQILRFGNSFTAASRLQDLCGYFGTSLLMDRDVAMVQGSDKDYISCVGKITPKGLEHPIHIFTVYKPGIHNCPYDIKEDKLLHYVRMKNEAIEYFVGNANCGIKPNFPIARDKLYQASGLFREMTGHRDIATERILEYIGVNNLSDSGFISAGMQIETKSGNTPLGVQLYPLSQDLLRALDREFYDGFVLNREWEQCFKLEWRWEGEVILESGQTPDGIYFITKGEVRIVGPEGKVIAVVKEGDVFGEMAYFSHESVRSATVIANSDLVLYRISGEDFVKFPAIRHLFEKIAQKRILERQKRNLVHMKTGVA